MEKDKDQFFQSSDEKLRSIIYSNGGNEHSWYSKQKKSNFTGNISGKSCLLKYVI